MKKALLMLLLFVGSIVTCIAQNVQEVVYLKNGSVVRGIVIEQVPGVSLKIQTSDGSIFVYQTSEIDKITKEINKPKNKRYRGFLDAGYTFGVGDWGVDRLEFFTSHGCQLNPHLYIGGGIGISCYENSYYALPIFAHIRANISDNYISPYLDFKIGYSPSEDVKGVYLSPAIGCKIKAFNISIGYIMQKAEQFFIQHSVFSQKTGHKGLEKLQRS